jgi:hypothetical protein
MNRPPIGFVAILLGAVFAIDGCQSNPIYSPPTSGPTALVRMGSTQRLSFGFTYKSCDGPALADTPLKNKELIVPGNREVTLMIGRGYCNIPIGFHAAAGRQYEIDFTQSGEKCFVSVTDTSTPPGTSVPLRRLTDVRDLGKCVN